MTPKRAIRRDLSHFVYRLCEAECVGGLDQAQKMIRGFVDSVPGSMLRRSVLEAVSEAGGERDLFALEMGY